MPRNAPCTLSFQRLLLLLLLTTILHQTHGHGYLKSPRSRNLVAHEDTVWWPLTDNNPQPETCPHCLNRGGTRARCGLTEDNGGVRNYDTPKNALQGSMPTNIQAEWEQGSDVVLDIVLTAHHKGHFVFSACSIQPGQVPTQECFDANPLTFVEDLVHGANFDPRYPERAYIAPVDDPDYVPDLGNDQGIAEYSFKMRLPPNLYGDLVLIQWYYLTANSCWHDGYQEYDWPASWKLDATSSGKCAAVSADGTGAPEQFWNCAEVKINRNLNNVDIPSPTPPSGNQQPTLFDYSSSIAIPVGLPSSNNKPSSAGSHGKTIVGYYASWQWYDRNKKAAPQNMDFTKVQRVNYAFFQTDTQGNMWGTDAWGDPNLLFGPYDWNPSAGAKKYCSWDAANTKACNSHNYEQGLIHLVHAAGAEIYPSLGGWTLSDPFPLMAAIASTRATFAQNCVDLIKEYDFDGIDIDWEYPGFASHSGTPQDRDNFKLLLNDVRAKLDELGAQTGRFYGLTAALPCGPNHIANMDIQHVADTLSELNLMTYDFHGAFSSVTGSNAPLYYQGWGEDDFDVHSCVENWLAGGGSRDKINIGLPFYGRSFSSATGMNQPHSGADQAVWGTDDGTPQFFNIVSQLPFMTSVWDPTTWTQYAYFNNGGLVSYDDENAICAKVQYAQEHNLNGFIIWELSGDLMDDLSTPLLDVTIKKLLDPSYQCPGQPGIVPDFVTLPGSNYVPTPIIPAPEPVFQAPPQPNGPTPVKYPTPFVPYYPPVSSPEPPQLPLNSQPGNLDEQPVPYYPPVSAPETPQLPLNSQPGNLDEQPVMQPPSYTQPEMADEASVILLCGNQQQGTYDENDWFEFTFGYELHRDPAVFVDDAVKDLKRSLLNGLAVKLSCSASGYGRSLRINDLLASRENIVAIGATQSDLPDFNTPCTVELNLSPPTACNSVRGSITARVNKQAASATLSDIANELEFFIRTSMAAGLFESALVRKAIFIDNTSQNPLKFNAAPSKTNMVWQPHTEAEHGSPVVAIILSLVIIILVGIILFMIVQRRKRDQYVAEYQPTEQAVRHKPDEARSAISRTYSTEQAWKQAVDTDEVWRNAIDAYEDESRNYSDEDNLEMRQMGRTPDGMPSTFGAPVAKQVSLDPTQSPQVESQQVNTEAENDTHEAPFEPDERIDDMGMKVTESIAAFDEKKKKKRKKSKKKRKSDKRGSDGTLNSTEVAWKKAIESNEVWKKAMDTYETELDNMDDESVDGKDVQAPDININADPDDQLESDTEENDLKNNYETYYDQGSFDNDGPVLGSTGESEDDESNRISDLDDTNDHAEDGSDNTGHENATESGQLDQVVDHDSVEDNISNTEQSSSDRHALPKDEDLNTEKEDIDEAASLDSASYDLD